MSTYQHPPKPARPLEQLCWRTTVIEGITLLLCLLPGISIAQNVEAVTTKHSNLIFIVPALIIIVGLVSRVLLKRHMEQLMFSSSEDETGGTPELLNVGEVPARALPEFDIVDCLSDLPEAQANRKKLEKINRKELGRALRYEMLIALIYILPTPFMDGVSYIYIVIPFVFISLLRYFAFRHPSRAHSKGVSGFLGPVFHSFLTIAEPNMRVVWHGILMFLVAAAAFMQFAIGAILLGALSLTAIMLHAWLFRRLQSKSGERKAFKLLVLRVFGIDETMGFTFTGLLDYWRHFGPYFMVADPTLLKTQRSRNGTWVYVLLVAVFLTIILVDELPQIAALSPLALQLIASLVVILVGIVWFLIARNRITQQFVISRKDVLHRVEQLSAHPLNWNLNYRTLLLYCHDDTWRIAVAECMQAADAVMMDLRGFSEERQGCKYEVDFLFDAIPAERIVFLVDENCLDLVQKTITEKWRELRTVSPNLENAEPRINLYLTQKENRRDMQGVLDLLLLRATK